MRRNLLNNVVGRLRAQAKVQSSAVLTDGDLLERYLTSRDESAFEALVQRHGPMVFAVCRRVAENAQDAEDAFQATFLVLVRKAATIRPRHLVGNWLYGVAYRAGMKVRTASYRQRTRERPMKKLPESAALEAGQWDDLLPVLDHEISTLPDKYRLPILLCDLEGKTRKEAARNLGWPEGTVAGRLAQARELLARRLMKQGLPASGAAVAALLAESSASANMPAALASTTVAALAAPGPSVPAKVAALADTLVKSMLIAKLKSMTVCVLVLVGLGLSASFLATVTPDRGEVAAASNVRIDQAKGVFVSPAQSANTGSPGPDENFADNELSKLQGTWNKAAFEIEGRPNARFANVEPYYNFTGNRFAITDSYRNVLKRGTVKILADGAINLQISGGQGKGTTLLLRYVVQPDQLRLAFNDEGMTRPREMKTTGGAGTVIYTFKRIPPLEDPDRRALQGAWNVISYVNSGNEASAKYLAQKHQWIFADDKIIMRDQAGPGREGTFLLYETTKPAGITLQMNPPQVRSLPRGAGASDGGKLLGPETLQGIYLLKDDTLTVCVGAPGVERPTKFLSTFESKTSVVTLRRKQDPKAKQPTLEEIGGLWHIDGNKFHGNLIMLPQKDGKLAGNLYAERMAGEYDARAGRVVLSRYGRAPATLQTVVQIYTGDIVPSSDFEAGYYIKGTFSAVMVPQWGAAGARYPWTAIRHQDYIKTVSINTLMKLAHLTPGNRSTKDNLDNRLIDGVANPIEQKQLLELYQELARREPPRGGSGPLAYAMRKNEWKKRTVEMVESVKAAIKGDKDAPARLSKARDCRACHEVHRLAADAKN